MNYGPFQSQYKDTEKGKQATVDLMTSRAALNLDGF